MSSVMANCIITYHLRSRCIVLTEVAKTHTTCNVGPSSVNVFIESSGCKSIADKTIIVAVFYNHLLSIFVFSLKMEKLPLQKNRPDYRISETAKLMIQNEFCRFMKMEISAEVRKNDLKYDPTHELVV